MRYLLLLFLVIPVLLYRCNHGLSPSDSHNDNPQNLSGISGTIIYKNWPPADSLVDLRLIAFRKFPPQNIFGEIISGEAIVYPPIDTSAHLRFNVLFEEYIMELPVDTFEYIVVAHQYGDNLFADWQAVGQYDPDSDSLPDPVIVIQDSLLENIRINVDFQNLPYQPFENR